MTRCYYFIPYLKRIYSESCRNFFFLINDRGKQLFFFISRQIIEVRNWPQSIANHIDLKHFGGYSDYRSGFKRKKNQVLRTKYPLGLAVVPPPEKKILHNGKPIPRNIRFQIIALFGGSSRVESGKEAEKSYSQNHRISFSLYSRPLSLRPHRIAVNALPWPTSAYSREKLKPH